MMHYLTQGRASAERQGVILLIVIILLTLFAVVGLAFILYADSEATASRIFREAQGLEGQRPDIPGSQLLNYSLGQLLFDTDDKKNPYSAMRGQGLARDMYGWNSDIPANNIFSFSGTGHFHTSAGPAYTPGAYMNPFNIDD